ncbi:hypothetical protein [Arthrobacter sp. Soil764]|uniref:hypothetical protein n=1 Tax=Arthrobacter sp. Soil764 TaxID=1736403 RepID=UPI0006FC271C|nr:hypothetical protein [Arthrobacter sp. Soil764]KRE84027.1 hypothetical protein ASG86_05845 [Arthrobacter sp. Soil764]
MTVPEDNSIGFGIAEMAYILQLQNTAAATESANWLRLRDESTDLEMIRAGLSSLVARGMASATAGSELSFTPQVDVVAYTLAKAARWTQIDLLQSAVLGDTVLQIESDRTKLLFQPRTMQAWFVLPQDPATSAEAAQSYLVRDHLATHPEGGVRLRTSGPEGEYGFLVRQETEGWVCAAVDGDNVGPATAPLSEAGLRHSLLSFRTGSPLTDD